VVREQRVQLARLRRRHDTVAASGDRQQCRRREGVEPGGIILTPRPLRRAEQRDGCGVAAVGGDGAIDDAAAHRDPGDGEAARLAETTVEQLVDEPRQTGNGLADDLSEGRRVFPQRPRNPACGTRGAASAVRDGIDADGQQPVVGKATQLWQVRRLAGAVAVHPKHGRQRAGAAGRPREQ
jgi:hypothetical protein